MGGSERLPCLAGLLLLVVVFFPSGALAQDGWYLGMSVGMAVAPGMRVHESDNDWSTKCDLISNPEQIEVGEADCLSAPPPGAWYNDIDGGLGTLAGLTIGYGAARIRVEGEISYRTVTYGGPVPMVIGDVTTRAKADQELEVAEGSVDDVWALGVGGNVFVHSGSLYVGAGVGSVLVGLDRFTRWKRNDDPSKISTFDDPVMKARIAGTTSISNHRLHDVLISYQVMAGYDHALSELMVLGLKLRWTRLSEFADDAPFTQIRSHESSVGRGFEVRYRTNTSGLSAIGLALTMKYAL